MTLCLCKKLVPHGNTVLSAILQMIIHFWTSYLAEIIAKNIPSSYHLDFSMGSISLTIWKIDKLALRSAAIQQSCYYPWQYPYGCRTLCWGLCSRCDSCGTSHSKHIQPLRHWNHWLCLSCFVASTARTESPDPFANLERSSAWT